MNIQTYKLLYSVFLIHSYLNYALTLIHQEVQWLSCSRDEPVFYESFLLTVNEGLRLSCEVCEYCEPENKTKECEEPDFSLPPEEIKPITISEKYAAFKKQQKDTINQSMEYVEKTGKEALTNVRYKDEIAQNSLGDVSSSGKLGEFLPKIFFTKTDISGAVNIIQDDLTTFIAQDFLLFRRTQVSHTGIYDCFWRAKKRKSWSITVRDAGREPFREIYSKNNKTIVMKNNRKLRNLNMPKANLIIFSKWTEWSDCNICTIKERKEIMWGIKMRAGYCYIRKINLNQPTRPKNAIDLISFKKGLPCRSPWIPTEIRGLKAVAYRPSELEIEQCFIYCKKKDYYKAIFNVSGKMIYEYRYRTGLETANILVDYNDGAFIRKVNNTEDDMQTDPTKDAEEVEELNNYKLKPPRTGNVEFEVGRDDNKIAIKCPFTGSITGGFMWFEIWKKPGKSLEELIRNPFDFMNTFRKSRGRVKFDPGYNIIISSILPTDNYKMYVCMHENRIIGTIHLVYVNKAQSDEIIHVISQLAVLLMPTLLVLMTLVFIFLTLRSKVIKQKKTKKSDDD